MSQRFQMLVTDVVEGFSALFPGSGRISNRYLCSGEITVHGNLCIPI